MNNIKNVYPNVKILILFRSIPLDFSFTCVFFLYIIIMCYNLAIWHGLRRTVNIYIYVYGYMRNPIQKFFFLFIIKYWLFELKVLISVSKKRKFHFMDNEFPFETEQSKSNQSCKFSLYSAADCDHVQQTSGQVLTKDKIQK